MIKPDDRVRVYATLNGSVAETKGTVTRIRADGMLYVNLDGRRGEIVAHPKQVRRLVKRRSVWIHASDLIQPGVAPAAALKRKPQIGFGDYIEFREVRRGKNADG